MYIYIHIHIYMYIYIYIQKSYRYQSWYEWYTTDPWDVDGLLACSYIVQN